MIPTKDLGSLIQKHRKEAELTQGDLAEKTGLSRNYISDIENGRYAPSLATLSKIATHLEFDLNLLKVSEIQVKITGG